MPALVTNSKIWGEMFGTSEMHYLFSDEKTTQLYLDVEAALARSQSKLSIIPSKAGEKISVRRIKEAARILKYRYLTSVYRLPLLLEALK